MTSVSWNDGYAVGTTYPVQFQQELAPEHLNYVCLRNGAVPLPLDRPYTYFELGCGQGFSTNIIAASNPMGQFYANDFMPDHVVHARRLAEAAQLTNMQFLEQSFEELADGKVDLPQFDFVTLHGVYAWISPENQAHIVRFLTRYLKTGGVVYVGYNALPGWAPGMQIQRLMHLAGELKPSVNNHVKLIQVRQMVQQMAEAKSKFLLNNSDLQFFLDALKKQPVDYLVHEYLHASFNPKLHVDVAHELSHAKLDFLASANLDEVGQTPSAPPEILQDITDQALARTIEDFMLNTKFRKDIFTRGRSSLLNNEALQYYEQCQFALSVTEQEAQSKVQSLLQGPVSRLAQGPCSLFEMAQWSPFGGQLKLVLDFTTLLHEKQLGFMFMSSSTPKDTEPAQRMNRELARRACFEDRYHVLASPLLGTGIPSNRIESLVYGVVCEQPDISDSQMIATVILKILQGTETHSLESLTAQVASILESKLPLWRQLQVI